MLDRLRPAYDFVLRWWPAFAGAVAFALLAGAHGFEKIGGLEPCPLCLRQREFHWAALAIAVASFWWWRKDPDGAHARTFDIALAAAFGAGAIVAAYHTGVEYDWWPGPATCSGGSISGISGADIAAALGGGQTVVTCDDAAWRDPVLTISMAGWNALISAGCATAGVLAALRRSPAMEPAHA